MANDTRIEKATREYVGATLTGEQIKFLVRESSPEWKGGIYPSDVAYVRTNEGFVPRGKDAYGDGVLEYIGTDAFRVLATEDIVRKERSGRGRGATVPTSPETLKAQLATVKAKMEELKAKMPVPVPAKGKGKDGSATV